jgi:hypothetical protein
MSKNTASEHTGITTVQLVAKYVLAPEKEVRSLSNTKVQDYKKARIHDVWIL